MLMITMQKAKSPSYVTIAPPPFVREWPTACRLRQCPGSVYQKWGKMTSPPHLAAARNGAVTFLRFFRGKGRGKTKNRKNSRFPDRGTALFLLKKQKNFKPQNELPVCNLFGLGMGNTTLKVTKLVPQSVVYHGFIYKAVTKILQYMLTSSLKPGILGNRSRGLYGELPATVTD